MRCPVCGLHNHRWATVCAQCDHKFSRPSDGSLLKSIITAVVIVLVIWGGVQLWRWDRERRQTQEARRIITQACIATGANIDQEMRAYEELRKAHPRFDPVRLAEIHAAMIQLKKDF